MGLRLKNKWLLALLNGILFFLPHAANPEMASGSILIGLGYFAMGFFLTLITLQDHGHPVRYRNIWIRPSAAEKPVAPVMAGEKH